MKIILCSREEKDNALSHGAVLCTEEEADFLMHFRTRGSKNGVRRWQYEDGSLTPEGYIHYGIGQGNKYAKKAEKYEKKSEKLEKKASKALRSSGRTHVLNTLLKRKNGEKSDLLSLRTGVKLTKAAKNSMRANRFERKAKRFEKKAKEQEEKGRAEFEKDKKLNQEAEKSTEKAVDKFIEDWNKAYEKKDLQKDNIKETKEEHKDINKSNEFTPEEDGLTGKERADYWKNAYESKEERERSLRHFTVDNPKSFDKMDGLAQKNVGDDILDYLTETQKEFKNMNKDERQTYEDIQLWLTDRIYDKSGSWNSGEYNSNSNAAKLVKSEKFQNVQEDLFKRYDVVSKKSGTSFGYDAKKFMEACKKDSVWSELEQAYKKQENNLLGAILRDIGFRDTPENRSMIMQFAFMND